MPERYVLSEEMAKLVRETVHDYLNRVHHDAGARNRRTVKRDKPAIYQAQCTEEIAAATDELTEPGLGKARLLIRDGDDLKAYEPDRIVDVVNHSDSASFAVDQYLKVELIDNQWQPYYPSGGGGGGLFAWGTAQNVNCTSGTLDVLVTHVSECPPSGWPDYTPSTKIISPVWDLEAEGGWPLFPGHTESELNGKRCRIEYVYDIEECGGRWVLLDIYTSDGCI
jgi:hypothetical protein